MNATMSIAQMLKAGLDVSWLFEPIVAEHFIPQEDQLSRAKTVGNLADVARTQGLDQRSDVRSALRAVDTIVLAEAASRSLTDAIPMSDAVVSA
ncbi:hypothetical protein [Sphingomonas sp. 22176]|uniref:hypothetical protein n=1 Tax=Sphingomonas sp. 22176 TaxID=3453884 RepID=UPI003F8242C7